MRRWEVEGRLLAGDGRPRIMGIVNVTPDSFSGDGRLPSPTQAAAIAARLVAEGADLIDVGAESTRPGAVPVPLDDELRRLVPAIEAIAAAVAVPISVDTMKPELARRALAAGASIVNDVTGLADPSMRSVVADTGAAAVAMHMRGDPLTMQDDPTYLDVTAEIADYLAARVEQAEADGILRRRLAVDPGIGFGKTHEHNLTLLRSLDRLGDLGCAILIGASRKGFLGHLTGRPRHERATASAACALAAFAGGADVCRVHDVGPTADAVKVWGAIRGWPRGDRLG